MHRRIRNLALFFGSLGLLACSGTANTDLFGEGGGSATGTGTGVDCDCAFGAYFPACGVDGKTYDATCGIECVPVEVECDGVCPCVDCDELAQQYREALADARACSPFIDVEQCTEQIGDQLACPCFTYVNPVNTEAMDTLAALRTQWNEQRCSEGLACPTIECAQPLGGLCTEQAGSGDVGSCVDDFGVSGSGSDS